MGATVQQQGQYLPSSRDADGQLQRGGGAEACHQGMAGGGLQLKNGLLSRFSEDIGSTSGPSGRQPLQASLSDMSLYREESVSPCAFLDYAMTCSDCLTWTRKAVLMQFCSKLFSKEAGAYLHGHLDTTSMCGSVHVP